MRIVFSLDRLIAILFFAGLAVIVFFAGAAAIYYRLPPHAWLHEAFVGGKAWWHEAQRPAASQPLTSVPLTGKTVWDQKRAFKGYTLLVGASSSRAELIDMNGQSVFHWQLPVKEIIAQGGGRGGRIFMIKAMALPGGDLIAVLLRRNVTPYGYGVVKLDRHSRLLWFQKAHAHHDLYLSQEDDKIYTLTHTFLKEPLSGGEALRYPILNDYITTLSGDGKILDHLPLLEAFIGSPYASFLLKQSKLKKKWDLLHTNSIVKLEPSMARAFPQFKAGSFLVSVRDINAIAVIDPHTRQTVWAYDGPWKKQHHASFLANGNILLFDNQGDRSGKKPGARILEIDPVTSDIVWKHGGFQTHHFGRVHRLPNGNTLIVQSLQGRAVEVTPEGKTVWDYRLPKKKKQNILTSAIRYTAAELPFLAEK